MCIIYINMSRLYMLFEKMYANDLILKTKQMTYGDPKFVV